jgi:hypothetical protein
MINLSKAQDVISKGHLLLLAEIDKASEEIEIARTEILEEISSLSAHVREKRNEEQFLVVRSHNLSASTWQ